MFTYSFSFFSYWCLVFVSFPGEGGAEGEGKKTRKAIGRNYVFLYIYMYVFRFKGLVFKAVVRVKANKTTHPRKKEKGYHIFTLPNLEGLSGCRRPAVGMRLV
jgi:hypothetical protein